MCACSFLSCPSIQFYSIREVIMMMMMMMHPTPPPPCRIVLLPSGDEYNIVYFSRQSGNQPKAAASHIVYGLGDGGTQAGRPHRRRIRTYTLRSSSLPSLHHILFRIHTYIPCASGMRCLRKARSGSSLSSPNQPPGDESTLTAVFSAFTIS